MYTANIDTHPPRFKSRKLLLWTLLGLFLSSWFSTFGCQKQSEPVLPTEPLGKKTQAVIGGKVDLSHPAVGTITINRRTYCTATLISPKVILTAAHCMDPYRSSVDSGSKLDFRIELPDKTRPEGYRYEYFPISPQLLSVHPKWLQHRPVVYIGDMAIAILEKPLTKIPFMPINRKTLDSSWLKKKGYILGYGMIQTQPVPLRIHRKYGAEVLITKVEPDRVAHFDKGKSVCHGDSGGPLLMKIDNKWQLVAVHSHTLAGRVPGASYSACNLEGVSLRVDAYLPYVDTFLAIYGGHPGTCKQDKNCGFCGVCDNTKKQCSPNIISKRAKHCQACQQDSDCQGGICRDMEGGGRCLQPCQNELCCPKGSFCRNIRKFSYQKPSLPISACIAEDGSCPVLTCQQDSDCGRNGVCQQKKCVTYFPPKQSSLCQPCQAHKDCGVGNLCIGLPGQRRCRQACDSKERCPKGFFCASVADNQPKQCIPESRVCQIPCSPQQKCPGGMQCKDGSCRVPTPGTAGALCDATPCQKGLACVQTHLGKRCLKMCGLSAGEPGGSCTADHQCKGGHRCILANHDYACYTRCKTDTDCKNTGSTTCLETLCSCFNDNMCKSGFFCYQNRCVEKSKFGACPKGSQCLQIPRATGQYCIPDTFEYRALGQSCNPLQRCKKGLVCLTSSGTSGTCVQDCTATKKCDSPSVCRQVRVPTKQHIYICTCLQKNQPCRGTGAMCQELSYFQKQFSICRRNAANRTCTSDIECMYGTTCNKGYCGTPPPQEPKPENPSEIQKETVSSEPIETSSEPTVQEIAKEESPGEPIPEPSEEPTQEKEEPKTELIVEKPEAEPDTSTSTPDASAEEPKEAKVPEPPPASGCNCQSSPASPNQSFLGWFLLLGILFFRPLRPFRKTSLK